MPNKTENIMDKNESKWMIFNQFGSCCSGHLQQPILCSGAGNGVCQVYYLILNTVVVYTSISKLLIEMKLSHIECDAFCLNFFRYVLVKSFYVYIY